METASSFLLPSTDYQQILLENDMQQWQVSRQSVPLNNTTTNNQTSRQLSSPVSLCHPSCTPAAMRQWALLLQASKIRPSHRPRLHLFTGRNKDSQAWERGEPFRNDEVSAVHPPIRDITTTSNTIGSRPYVLDRSAFACPLGNNRAMCARVHEAQASLSQASRQYPRKLS